jgi:hypothetical protein
VIFPLRGAGLTPRSYRSQKSGVPAGCRDDRFPMMPSRGRDCVGAEGVAGALTGGRAIAMNALVGGSAGRTITARRAGVRKPKVLRTAHLCRASKCLVVSMTLRAVLPAPAQEVVDDRSGGWIERFPSGSKRSTLFGRRA